MKTNARDGLNKVRALRQSFQGFIDFADVIEEFAAIEDAVESAKRELVKCKADAEDVKGALETGKNDLDSMNGALDDLRVHMSELNSEAALNATQILEKAESDAESMLLAAKSQADSASEAALARLSSINGQISQAEREFNALDEQVAGNVSKVKSQEAKIAENDSRLRAFNEAASDF